MPSAREPLPALARLVASLAANPGSPPAAPEPMPGGASTRRFYRVSLGGSGTAVAMWFPDATKPDEIAKTDESGRRWPFLEVRDLLAARGIRVPAVVAEACADGLLLVEDLGDDTLAAYLSRRPATRESLYQLAVRDLARAQRALATLPEGSIVRARAFDTDLLRWEVDHFREWALEARGIQLDAGDREVFDAAADHLASTIASWPRGFVHRDYQSRNLMVREVEAREELVWIDFQDALLGPRVYDLVALLNDSYQTFTREFVEARLGEYCAHLGLPGAALETIVREFDLVTVQRKLKDAGRFVFIDRTKGNPGFLQFVEPTIAKARASLARLRDDPRLAALDDVLARVAPGDPTAGAGAHRG
ncbi:MAG: phosphotransferase [Polyangiaceae bacterium]|nr:phosphotransferase [Polyangiaceae bacterium]